MTARMTARSPALRTEDGGRRAGRPSGNPGDGVERAVTQASERRHGIPWLVRRPHPGPPPQPRGSLRCSARDCEADTGVACTFTDRRLRRCPTAWCPDHQSVVSGSVYCRRHAGIAQQMAMDEAGAFLPDVDNRAAGLCAWLAAALDGAIRRTLDDLVRPGVDTVVASPLRPVFTGPSRERSWERCWKLSDRTGIIVMVALEVSERRSDEVVARVNRQEIARAVPPWITARDGAPGGHDGAAARAAFLSRLAISIATAVRAPGAKPMRPS